MPLHLRIVTPEREAFSEEVDSLTLPGAEGELGILPQHAALVTTLKPGELSYTQGGKTQFLAVGEGFAEVLNNRVSIVSDLAVGEDEIDEAAIQAAMERAQAAMANQSLEGEDLLAAQALIAKSIAQLHLKRRRRY